MEDRLRKFAQLIDTGSFTRAAAEIHISQPALSTAIKKLERELHTELLVRGNHSLKLTPAGHLAYRAGKNLEISASNLKQSLTELAQQKTAIAIGMIDSIADMLFVHHDELQQLEQWAHVSLSINNSTLLTQNVLHDKLDAAIIARQPTPLSRTVRTTSIGSEPLVVVTHVGHHAELIEAMKYGVIPQFFSYNQSSTTHGLIEQAAALAGYEIQPIFYSTSPEIILKLVLSQKGVAALPYLMVKEYLEAGVLTKIPLSKNSVIERHIVAIHHANRKLPPALDATLKRTQTYLKQLMSEAKSS